MEGLEPRGTKPKKPSDSGIVSSAARGREVGFAEITIDLLEARLRSTPKLPTIQEMD